MIRPDFKNYKGFGLSSLFHSAKGSTWEEHKYVKRIDGTYYYPNGYEGGRNISSIESSKGSGGKDNDSDESSSANKNNSELSESDIENLAREVIRGNFGNGQVRKDLLAGNYDAIQKRVNELTKTGVGSKKISEASKEVEDIGKKALDKAVSTLSTSSNNSKTADISKVFSVYNKHRAK